MADNDEIGILNWAQTERRSIEEFIFFWAMGRKGNNPNGIPGDQFPLKMTLADWDEQYRSWRACRE